MGKYTKEDILRIAQEENVKFVRLQFTDILGQLKNVAITVSQLEKALNNECMFDGSSIEGFVRIEESDMYLRPDYDSFVIFPWRPQFGKVARLICDVYRTDGTPFEGDPRYILKRAIWAILLTLARNANFSCFMWMRMESLPLKPMTRAGILTLVQWISAKTAAAISA
mgnify:CR=1 FL=1